MAHLSDDTSPRRLVRDAAYYAELRRKLDAPIQAIPARIGSLAPAGRPALPPWVQAKLDEQAGQKAEADALRRLAPVNQPIVAPKPSTKSPKIAPSQPKPSPTDRFTAPRAPAPVPPVDRAFQRGTPEYNARLKEILTGRTQGIAPGYGSLSTPGEPARRTDPTPSRPFSLLSDPDDELTAPGIPVTPPKSPRLADILRKLGNDDELAAQRVSVSTPPPISPPQQAPGQPRHSGPPPLSPEAEQQLWDVGLAQEAATYAGGRSAYAELLKDQQIWDQGLAGELAASVASESGYERALDALRTDEARLQEEQIERVLVEPKPVTGPGARLFELSPNEESLFASISPEEFVPEALIEFCRRDARIPVTKEELEFLAQFP